jgi:hypothetical protein
MHGTNGPLRSDSRSLSIRSLPPDQHHDDRRMLNARLEFLQQTMVPRRQVVAICAGIVHKLAPWHPTDTAHTRILQCGVLCKRLPWRIVSGLSALAC